MDEAMGLSKLMGALVKFQSECPALSFDKTVKTGKYKFDYVTLAKMVDVTKPLLAKNGLFISQLPICNEKENYVKVKTILGHESGQSISSDFEMKIPATTTRDGKTLPITPQDVGSGISYAKRYAYGAILSLITDEDTDGHSPNEIYQGSKEDAAWLKSVCEELGVTDKTIMRGIHDKLLQDTSVKDKKLVSKLID